MNYSSVVCCHSSLLLPKSLRRNPDSDVQETINGTHIRGVPVVDGTHLSELHVGVRSGDICS